MLNKWWDKWLLFWAGMCQVPSAVPVVKERSKGRGKKIKMSWSISNVRVSAHWEVAGTEDVQDPWATWNHHLIYSQGDLEACTKHLGPQFAQDGSLLTSFVYFSFLCRELHLWKVAFTVLRKQQKSTGSLHVCWIIIICLFRLSRLVTVLRILSHFQCVFEDVLLLPWASVS